MSRTDKAILAMYIVFILACLAVAAAMPFFEAKSFNECTGGSASYITALTTELRVENCDREDTHGTK